jgi:hypothetical protein
MYDFIYIYIYIYMEFLCGANKLWNGNFVISVTYSPKLQISLCYKEL